ncbi:Protein of unknown function [Gryllus bimaculatus]|nr:Protein of unknown function [Gryllus bimaculatus]
MEAEVLAEAVVRTVSLAEGSGRGIVSGGRDGGKRVVEAVSVGRRMGQRRQRWSRRRGRWRWQRRCRCRGRGRGRAGPICMAGGERSALAPGSTLQMQRSPLPQGGQERPLAAATDDGCVVDFLGTVAITTTADIIIETIQDSSLSNLVYYCIDKN